MFMHVYRVSEATRTPWKTTASWCNSHAARFCIRPQKHAPNRTNSLKKKHNRLRKKHYRFHIKL